MIESWQIRVRHAASRQCRDDIPPMSYLAGLPVLGGSWIGHADVKRIEWRCRTSARPRQWRSRSKSLRSMQCVVRLRHVKRRAR